MTLSIKMTFNPRGAAVAAGTPVLRPLPLRAWSGAGPCRWLGLRLALYQLQRLPHVVRRQGGDDGAVLGFLVLIPFRER